MQDLILATLLAPGSVFLAFAFIWLCGWHPREKFVSRLTGLTYGFSFTTTLALGWLMAHNGVRSVSVPLGDWFSVHSYEFPLILSIDRLSLPLVALTTFLVGLVGVFSTRYLHRERGFFRFFLLLHLFAFGALLIFSAGSIDLLIGGWELVGITSVLLVAFFQERPDPVQCAIRVFAVYRISDIGLLVALFLMHHFTGTATFSELFTGEWPRQTAAIAVGPATLIGLLLLFAASGKSAQFPFSSWLPRAMEGPTPSSAIFYGAISVHAGAYMLLRTQPIFAAAPLASVAIVLVGLVTAVTATIIARASADSKTSIAYAALAQLGLIFVEIGLGFPRLALVHIIGHAAIRTLQFLRAPSMLHEFHQVHAAAGGHLEPTGLQYEALLPLQFRNWLYRFAIERGHQDALIDRYVVSPVTQIAGWFNAYERRIAPPRLHSPLQPAVEMNRSNEVTQSIAGGIDG